MLEIWDLFDENGNKTGEIMQAGMPVPKGLYHMGADVWIVNSENKILIQKRSPSKRLAPNVWAMTGGSVIKGETSLQTIQRETLEELGIKLNCKDFRLMITYKTGNVWVDEYITRQDVDLKDIVMQKEEVSEVKWATYEEVEQIFESGQFLKNRWEFVRALIRDFWKN